MKILVPSLLFVLAVAVMAPADAWAQGRGRGSPDAPPSAGDHGRDRHADQRALSDAVRRVERSTGGQVLSAERVPFDGRDVSRVKVVDSSGRVRVYMDDPQARGERARTRGDDNDND